MSIKNNNNNNEILWEGEWASTLMMSGQKLTHYHENDTGHWAHTLRATAPQYTGSQKCLKPNQEI